MQAENFGLGEIVASRIEFPAGIFGRSTDVLSDGRDSFHLVVSRASTSLKTGVDTIVDPGEAWLVDTSKPHLVTFDRASEVLSIEVPRKALLHLMPNAENLARQVIPRHSPVLALLSSYARSVFETGGMSTSLAATAGTHLLDLVALAIGATGDAAHLARTQGMRAARLIAIRESIGSDLANPEMSLRDIARLNGVSERYVQQLMEEAGTTFTDFVLDRRLMLAFRLLTHPLHRGRRVLDIAEACGFGDLSHFNRSFRRRFGATPSDVRSGRSVDSR